MSLNSIKVAVVLPPREGFGPGRTGAIGLLARRLAQTPGFQTIVFGGKQDGPVFPGIDFRHVSPVALAARRHQRSLRRRASRNA